MMLRTLNDTLDAAKMEHSELTINTEPFNPDYILSTVIESMGFSAEKKKIYLKYKFTGNKNAIVLGDSFRLKQIVVNLLSNAIKFTHEGGVTVNAQLIANDTRLQVEVTDTGAGISPEQQAGVFSKYYQTSSSKEQVGTGLGLFICKQLIKLQKGKIAVKSEEGKGTTFTLLIPYQKNEKKLPVVASGE
jgi:signal transduction histidine kinase